MNTSSPEIRGAMPSRTDTFRLDMKRPACAGRFPLETIVRPADAVQGSMAEGGPAGSRGPGRRGRGDGGRQ